MFRFASAALLTVSLFALAKSAMADSLSITYFTIGETDKDANHLATGTFSNEVQTHLGPDGLPILNTTAFGCVTGCYATAGAPTDVLTNGEITYWSPTLNKGGAGATSDVTSTLTTTTTLPFSDDTLFPPNGTGSGDGNGFQAAHLFGTIDAPTTENISFSIASDDMAFVYIDGNLVCSDGGVHAESAGTCTTLSAVSAGSHSFDLFFVDINNVASALDFSITTQGVTTTPTVPEPSTFMLFGTGLLGAAGAIRRRFVR
jgi:fibro-slime domain-containing protein